VYAVTITLWSTRGNGRVAEVQFTDGIGGGRVNLYQNSGQTYMFYETWAGDPSSYGCINTNDQYGNPIVVCYYAVINYEYGWGLVFPDGLNVVQFTATSARFYGVTGPAFSNTRCRLYTSDGHTVTNKTCTAGLDQSFDLSWTANDLSTEDASRTTQYGIGPFTFTSQGAVNSDSAFVTGSINGRGIYNAPGRLGDTIKSKNVATQVAP